VREAIRLLLRAKRHSRGGSGERADEEELSFLDEEAFRPLSDSCGFDEAFMMAFGDPSQDIEGLTVGMALLYAGAHLSTTDFFEFQKWWGDVVLQRNPPCRGSRHALRSQDFPGPGGSEWAPYREAFEWLFENPAAVRALRVADCNLLRLPAPKFMGNGPRQEAMVAELTRLRPEILDLDLEEMND
jgi:hypothetical protein